MVYSLTYRRPTYTPSRQSSSSINNSEKGEDHSETSSSDGSEWDTADAKEGRSDGRRYRDHGVSRKASLSSSKGSVVNGIPEALSFDRVMDNGTCEPCTVRDFLNYLRYIEHSAENLQFYLWLRDYEKRFAAVSPSDRTLSPEWTSKQHQAAMHKAQIQASQNPSTKVNHHAITQSFESNKVPGVVTAPSKDPFTTPPQTPNGRDNSSSAHSWDTRGASRSGTSEMSAASYRSVADGAFESAGLPKPFTIQPFRDEVNRIIVTYVIPNSPRELNISSRERRALLQALQVTTHPSAFRSVATSIEDMLRHQSHPNFIRWAICNGNKPRQIFAQGLGLFLIVVGFLVATLLTLSNAGRGWRAMGAIGWWLGTATLFAGLKGMCVVLHGMHHRHVRPWELFVDDGAEHELSPASTGADGVRNSYEDEPWVKKYKKRNIIRKIFDREVWIKEPALRQIQDTIFIQALLTGLAFAAICTAVFCAVPAGNFY